MAALQYLRTLFFPPEQHDDPKEWPRSKKNMVVVVISYCAFIAPLGSNIYMPAVLDIRDDLHTTSTLVSATLSVYVLVMGIMPVFWAALCDYSGRRPIYLISMMLFILGSLGAVMSPNIGMFFGMRALQAFGSSSVLSVGGGSLSDCFYSGERGTAFGLFYLGPLIAPMVGPTIGGLLSNAYGWRSTMWLLVIAATFAFLMVLFFLPETSRKNIERPATIKVSSTPLSEDPKEPKDHPSHIYSNHSTLIESHDSVLMASAEPEPMRRSSEISTCSSKISTCSSPAHAQTRQVLASVTDCHEEREKEKSKEEDDDDDSDDRHGPELSSLAAVASLEVGIQEMDEGKGKKKKRVFNPLRPLRCLAKPTNAILVGFNALALGAQFCMNNTLPISFDALYQMNVSQIGLSMIAGGLGSALGSLLGGRYSDFVLRQWLIRREVERLRCELAEKSAADALESRGATANHGSSLPEIDVKAVARTVNVKMSAPPEVRLRSVWLGVLTLPLGLLLFGWSIEYELSVAAPLVGMFLVGFGMMMVFSSATTALVDSNADNNMATSAVACNSFARGLTGALGGFIALPLLDAIGSGWLYTMWAILTILGSFGLLLMILRAETWRQRAMKTKKLDVA